MSSTNHGNPTSPAAAAVNQPPTAGRHHWEPTLHPHRQHVVVTLIVQDALARPARQQREWS